MATIPIDLSTKDLLKGVEQLEQAELENFVKEVLLIRAKRLADNFNHEESILFEQINSGLSQQETVYLQELATKSQSDTLTQNELKIYKQLSQKLEELNNRRLLAVSKLAQIRGVSFDDVMEEFGLMSMETI